MHGGNPCNLKPEATQHPEKLSELVILTSQLNSGDSVFVNPGEILQ